MLDMVRVGTKISSLRRSLGMSQEQLADRLFVTRQALSKWENGTSVPAVELLIEMSKIFRVSFEEILCLDVKETDIDPADIFKGRSRSYIVKMIADGSLRLDLAEVFYQFSPMERIFILRRIKEGALAVDTAQLWHSLSKAERHFLGSPDGVSNKQLKGGNGYEIC